MLLGVLNSVMVLFGLKMAGISAVASPQDVAAGKTTASVEHMDRASTSEIEEKNNIARRSASGTAVTRLTLSSSLAPVLSDSFIFSDNTAFVKPAPSSQSVPEIAPRSFVARPVSAMPQRPVARVAGAKKARTKSVRYQPGQVRQANRPKARAQLRVEGKTVNKRVVWMASRTPAASTCSNIVQFPAPKKTIPTALRIAA